MPKLSELEGCLAADRTGIRDRVNKVQAQKLSTQKDVYTALLRARRFIDKHFASPLMLDDLAKEAAMSPFKFNREFKQVFQCTPGQYLTERRLAYAQRLLHKESLSVLDIALSVGWESVTSFNKAFKKAFGLSPVEFRKSNLG